MKRSSYIILGTAGILMLAAFWPRGVSTVGSGDSVATGGTMEDMEAFESLDQCKAAAGMTAQRCDTEFAKAQENFALTAPKYGTMPECEDIYGVGQCRISNFQGTSVIVPALVGFLVARSLTGGVPTQALLPARTGPVACPPGNTLPECQPRQASSSGGGGGSSSSGRHYSTASGWSVFYGGSSSSAGRSSTTVTRTTTTSRSGTGWFGGSSVSRSSTSSSTVSRGGFGSTGRSFSSSS
jgi:hypothetical protein